MKGEKKTRMTPRCTFKNVSLVVGALLLVISVTVYAVPDKKENQQGRLLYGKVLDLHDNPVPNAIVYLTNMRTHTVKTYIIGQDGTYRFPGLTTVEYEVYAQYNNRKSATKSVSQFDDRPEVYVDLRIDMQ